MQSAIRLTVILAMAATSAPVFAGDEGGAAAATTKSDADRTSKEVGPSTEVRTGNELKGPGGNDMTVRGSDPDRLDLQAEKYAAIKEFNRRRFLRDTWALP